MFEQSENWTEYGASSSANDPTGQTQVASTVVTPAIPIANPKLNKKKWPFVVGGLAIFLGVPFLNGAGKHNEPAPEPSPVVVDTPQRTNSDTTRNAPATPSTPKWSAEEVQLFKESCLLAGGYYEGEICTFADADELDDEFVYIWEFYD